MKSNPSIAERDAVMIDKSIRAFERKCRSLAAAWITGNVETNLANHLLILDFDNLREKIIKIRNRP